MISFLIALAVLIGGYFVYGRFAERVFGMQPSRPTPVHTKADGVDFVPLPTWKIFLIQFLNIAGLGPIFGAIMGVMFGPAAFFWIALGTIFAGAVNDYFSGMMSIRQDGASLPEIVGTQLGAKARNAMRGFALLLMILVGAVFVYNPADLLAMLTPATLDRTFWIYAILLYYMAATMLPIDKLIGRIYPLFGLALLFMAAGIMVMLLVHGWDLPQFTDQFYNHKANADVAPIFPMMFVSIACGAISGFHATQSPMVARCLDNERHGRAIFYGAMVCEGIVALIWAAAAIAFTGSYEGLQDYLAGATPAVLVNNLSASWLGTFGGVLAVLGVVAAPITSGDTALRSARLIAADFMGVEQRSIVKRLLVCLPIFVLTFVVMLMPYEVLWRYFAWSNQVLATVTLWAIAVWLLRNNKFYWIALAPALFMTAVVVSYIFIAPEGINQVLAPYGIDVPYPIAVAIGAISSLGCWVLFGRLQRRPSVALPNS